MAPKKRLTAAARRAQLIEIGRSVFAERGYEATSVEEIAGRAGISKPILYEHFGGKEGLYAVVVDREIEYVVSLIAAAIESGTPRARIEAAALVFLTYVKDHPDGFAVLAHDSPAHTGGGGLSSLLHEVAAQVGEIFATSFKQSGYSPKYGPIYAHGLVGMVTFVGQWWTVERKPSVEVVAGHLSALAWMGLRHLPKKPAVIKRKRSK